MSHLITYLLPDESATRALGAMLAELDPVPRVIFLHGDLGAGKTTMVRGFLRRLGHQGLVRSPTYTLIESYALADHFVHHLDLYRLADPEELDYLGVRDLDGILLIEWPERARELLGRPDLEVGLKHAGHQREVSMQPLLPALAKALAEQGFVRR